LSFFLSFHVIHKKTEVAYVLYELILTQKLTHVHVPYTLFMPYTENIVVAYVLYEFTHSEVYTYVPCEFNHGEKNCNVESRPLVINHYTC